MRKVPNNIWTRAENSQNTRGSLTCEKSQTPSGNEPKTAKTECLTLRTDALKNKAYATPTYCKNQFERVQWPVPKTAKTQALALDAKSPKHHLDTSRKQPKHKRSPYMRKVPNTIWTRAENSQNRMSNVAYWRPKKQSLCHTYLLQKLGFKTPLAGSETAEQQQESCPTCLPSTAPRISNVTYWRPKKNKAQKLPFPTEQNHARWHQPVCHTDALKKTKLKNCHSQRNIIMQDGISQCAISFHAPWQTPLARSPYVTQGSADPTIYQDFIHPRWCRIFPSIICIPFDFRWTIQFMVNIKIDWGNIIIPNTKTNKTKYIFDL